MKKLILLCSILFSTLAMAEVEVNLIEINNDVKSEKEIERHWYNFGAVDVHSARYARYGIKNTGTTPMTFEGARINGMSFYANHNCLGVLKPGQRCFITIEFAPFSQGYHTGFLSIYFVEDYELFINLSGTGVSR